MPAGHDLLAERHIEGRARRGAGGLREKLGLHMLGLYRGRGGHAGKAAHDGDRQERAGPKGFHSPLSLSLA
jgi:hypothetical protein